MVGFDLGTLGFKIAELKRRFGYFTVVGQNQVILDSGTINRHGINQPEQLARLVAESFHQAKPRSIKNNQLIAALPESFIFTKSIDLPTGRPKEAIKTLQYTIQFEAAEIFPVPPDEVYLDYQVNSVTRQSTKILVVAAPKAMVNDLIKVMDQSGFFVQAIETKALALARLFIRTSEKRSVIFCDIGASVSKLSIFHDSQLMVTLTTAIGAKNLRHRIDSAKNLGKEISNIIKYYQDKYQQKDWQPEKIIISGGGAHVPKVTSKLGDATKLPAEIGVPVIKIVGYDPQFAVAYGLSLGR